MYQAAQLVAGSERWPYHGVLDQRIADAAENAARFRREPAESGRAIMFESAYTCMAYHQPR